MTQPPLIAYLDAHHLTITEGIKGVSSLHVDVSTPPDRVLETVIEAAMDVAYQLINRAGVN